MKLFFTLLFLSISIFANEHRVLVSGFTKHEHSHDKEGERYNEENWGAGYEFTAFKEYGELYFAGNFTILKDSYSDAQFTLSASPNVRYKVYGDLDASIGMAAFLMWKKDTYKTGVSSDEAEYGLVPGVAPLASLYYQRFSVNLAYVPTMKMGSIDIVGFGIVYFGWKFN